MELSTRYTPSDIEGPIYKAWDESGAFQPPPEGEGAGRTFTIVIPPPNVTGVLHMGHALNGTVQDIVIRHRRKAGYDALWIPGTDHAGIATQAVVERRLLAEGKETREDLGREEFLKRVWDWKEKHGNIILEQFRALGCSCDWTRTAFTMNDDLSAGVARNLPAEGVDLRRASILDVSALREAVDGCRFVFHQAAMVSVPQSVEQPQECFSVNVMGTERVLRAARDAGVSRVVFAASAAAYGDAPQLPCREDQLPRCGSPYAASKVAGEMLCEVYSRCYRLSTVSLRYFNIYGPGQNPDSPYAAVITAFAKALGGGARPTVFGDGRQTRDFTHVDDVVHANLLAGGCERPLAGEIMNIGTSRSIDLLEILECMGRVLGVDSTPTMAPPRPGDVRFSVADITRARELIGYEPSVTFDAGIERLLRGAPDRTVAAKKQG